MKEKYLVLSLLLLTGCGLFEQRQNEVKSKAKAAEKKAKKIQKDYKAEIREIKPYVVYSYQTDKKDPFRTREFVNVREKELEVYENKEKTPVVVCEPPKCVPPEPHPPQLLENYELAALAFVGTLGSETALIQTPDFGVIEVGVGDYLGSNNGMVVEIKETGLILQEKIFRSGIWEDKKTVLMIKQ